jgi:SSS family solute:Na+ symporter
MLSKLLIATCIYLAIIISLALYSRKGERTSKNYLMAGSSLGSLLGMFTFAATLFSTFTLMGMPDFFRVHGVGAWIFLAFSDALMVFGVIWFGYYLRKSVKESKHEYLGMAGFMEKRYQSKWVGYLLFVGVFIFLVPYVAIQIRGISIFLNQAFPDALPLWVWAVSLVVVMLVYSELGGLKAIIYSDILQGILLLTVVWIIGVFCLNSLGGMEAMFDQVEAKNDKLLSVPGPKGLFTLQFFIGSAMGIILLPFSQPHISTRLMIMKDNKSLYRMALGLGFFAILVILPTAFIGMYGAVNYADLSPAEFLGKTLIDDQSEIIAVLVTIGLIAAAISTSDSLLFALGGEVRSLLKGEDKEMLNITRVAIVVFGIVCLVFALLSNDQLVLLARTSFAGTSILAPLIFTGILAKNPALHKWLAIPTLIGLLLFVCSSLGVLPKAYVGIRAEIIIPIVLGMVALMSVFVGRRQV